VNKGYNLYEGLKKRHIERNDTVLFIIVKMLTILELLLSNFVMRNSVGIKHTKVNILHFYHN